MTKKLYESPKELPKFYPGLITLTIPSIRRTITDSFDSGIQSGLYRLNKDEVEALLLSFSKIARSDQYMLSPTSAATMKERYKFLCEKGNLRKITKDEQIALYLAFANNLTNIPAIASKDKAYDEAWRELLTHYEVRASKFIEIFGRAIERKTYYGWGYKTIPEAIFFAVNIDATGSYNPSSEYDIYSVAPKNRRILSEYFFGKSFLEPKLSETLPEDGNFIVENFESQIATDILTLDAVALNNNILKSNGAISTSAVKTIKKQTKIREFHSFGEVWPLDRIELVSLTYFIEKIKMAKNGAISVNSLAKFAVNEMPKIIEGSQFSSFFPEYQGFNKQWAQDSYMKILTEIIADFIKAAGKEWMSLSNLRLRLLCSEEDRGSILKFFPPKGRYKSFLMRRAENNEAVKPDFYDSIDWFEDITLKFAIHWLKYLCAVGVVELAIDRDYNGSEKYPLDGLRYVRLTGLGRYAFGLTATYTPPAAEISEGSPEYDSQNGIITLPNPDSPYKMFLSTIARQIGPSRFKLTVESLMKGCRKKFELENRINSLKTVINFDREAGLSDLVKEALNRTDCVEREGGYSLLKIKKHQKEIISLILNDKGLREIATVTPNKMVLVKTSALDKFFTLCINNGYLVE